MRKRYRFLNNNSPFKKDLLKVFADLISIGTSSCLAIKTSITDRILNSNLVRSRKKSKIDNGMIKPFIDCWIGQQVQLSSSVFDRN